MVVTLENVRSFARKHTFPLKPLTILVGENSSGKTTFLAILASLFSAKGFPLRPAFNDPPYHLGSYDSLATNGGRRHGAKHFSIGYKDEREKLEVLATYIRKAGEPALSALMLIGERVKLNASVEDQTVRGTVSVQPKESPNNIERTFENRVSNVALLSADRRAIAMLAVTGKSAEPPDQRLFEPLFALGHSFGLREALSVAPVRTKPKRTYDEMRADFDPEGDHIPLVLDRVLSAETGERERELLRKALEAFGVASGLFRRVTTKKLGKSASDPFQVMVAVDRQAFNLADVGYGVSQSLPVVVQSVLSSEARLLLLQQPEVHLHPRAQAALGSFFAGVVAAKSKEFVIETHSDFLVDRVRQEIARGTIASSSVGILFFSRKKGRSRVVPLELDAQGNIIGAPKNYREFFFKEQDALLSRSLF